MARVLAVAALVAGCMASGQALAQSSGPNALVDSVVGCSNERDDAARLRCFDAAVGALRQARSSGAIVVIDKDDVRRTRRSLFGFSLPKLPFFSGDDSADEAPEEIEAKITSARSLGYDKWQFELESGAVWHTTQASGYMKTPKAGQTVKLKKGTLGNYFASIAGSRAVRAMTVR